MGNRCYEPVRMFGIGNGAIMRLLASHQRQYQREMHQMDSSGSTSSLVTKYVGINSVLWQPKGVVFIAAREWLNIPLTKAIARHLPKRHYGQVRVMKKSCRYQE